MQRAVEEIHVSEAIADYVVRIVAATRSHGSVQVGASPRGSLAVFKLARCRAAMAGRDFVTPDDVKAIAAPALAHRLVLEPRAWIQRVAPEAIVAEVLAAVATPVADDATPAA
jgi:MoxR-like ATPase